MARCFLSGLGKLSPGLGKMSAVVHQKEGREEGEQPGGFGQKILRALEKLTGACVPISGKGIQTSDPEDNEKVQAQGNGFVQQEVSQDARKEESGKAAEEGSQETSKKSGALGKGSWLEKATKKVKQLEKSGKKSSHTSQQASHEGPKTTQQYIEPPPDPSMAFLKKAQDKTAFSPMRQHLSGDRVTPFSQNAGSLDSGRSGTLPPSKQAAFVTPDLRSKLVEDYNIAPEDVQTALSFAESEELCHVFCFTQAITGASMKDSIAVAMAHNYDISKLFEKYSIVTTGLAGADLNSSQQAVKQHALATYEEKQQVTMEDADRVEEDEILRLEGMVKGLPVEEALTKLGVPGPGFGKKDVVKALFPGRGSANRTDIENAKMSAAYKVALQVLERE